MVSRQLLVILYMYSLFVKCKRKWVQFGLRLWLKLQFMRIISRYHSESTVDLFCMQHQIDSHILPERSLVFNKLYLYYNAVEATLSCVFVFFSSLFIFVNCCVLWLLLFAKNTTTFLFCSKLKLKTHLFIHTFSADQWRLWRRHHRRSRCLIEDAFIAFTHFTSMYV